MSIEVPSPTWRVATGPRVAIDAGHHNYMIRENFAPFAEALEDDGFVVEWHDASLSSESLDGVDVLVIVNALHADNVDAWSLPTPSAFTDAEIEAVVAWVEDGGGLWLVADHHPFPGAAAALARRFGFELQNGFAFREPEPGMIEPSLIGFSRADQTIIGGHAITDGARPEERLEQLLSFTGEAFELPSGAQALFVLPADGVILLPERAWEFSEQTPRQPAGGWAAAAVLDYGRGRVAMFGEAAMLSARHVDDHGQWFGVGWVHPDARDNLQLVLNTARWLAG
ncbi:MAG TPA: hypothetical protein VM869_03250 [Enhygromyxa sp.]|nr:hypothetical protein [Enhygromyxa sp.]